MSKLTRLLRLVAVLGLALPLAAVVSAPASASPAGPVAPSPTHFFADHTQGCAYSYTRGELDWNPITIGGTRMVHLKGVLVDQASSVCHVRYPGAPFATFTAFVQGTKVDERVIPMGNQLAPNMSILEFNFTLSAFEARNPIIDQVDIQVCRTLGPMLPAFTCGDKQSYYRAQLSPTE